MELDISTNIHQSPTGWKHERDRHIRRINSILGDYLIKKEHQVKNPILDFLFEYYTFRPGLLIRWSPGYQMTLEKMAFKDIEDLVEIRCLPDGMRIDPSAFPTHRVASLDWVIQLIEVTMSRAPSFGCFGMHEWAMVYQTSKCPSLK